MGCRSESFFGSVRVSTAESSSSELHTIADVGLALAALITRDVAAPDRFGIEVEGFPIRVDRRGPVGRTPLSNGTPSVLGVIDELTGMNSDVLTRSSDYPRHETSTGGAVTFEPGGQIEFSSSPAESVDRVTHEADLIWNQLSHAFWEQDICLVNLGVDPWTDAASVAQQLKADRYRAMAQYLAARGQQGAVMMRNTCSLQVNLDQGTRSELNQRWLVANLVSPILTAMFATSPAGGARSARARAWQQLDVTRTGFPTWSGLAATDLVEDTLARALRADVIYVTRDDLTVVGRPGWSFLTWLREGHPVLSRPNVTDLEVHLSTLFTEVRARSGTLEFRSMDAIPQRWWEVPLTITGAALYDSEATGRIIDLLEPWAPRLNELWQSAAFEGLANPELQRAAAQLVTIAVEAARRKPHLFGKSAIRVTEEFADQYTLRGASPADDVARRLHEPRAVIEWAVPQHSLIGTG